MKTIVLIITLLAAAFTSSFPTSAAEKPAVAEKKEAKPRALPYQGKITAIDQQAKTLTIGERVFKVTPDTKITKNGQPAALSDAAAGEQVGLSYRKSEDNSLTLVSLRIGPKPDAKQEKK